MPSPAVHDVIDFDQNLSLATKGLADLQLRRAAEHHHRSGRTGLRQGEDRHRHGDHPASARQPLYTEPTKVTAFNGVPQGGKPTVLLHAYGITPLQTTLVLVGVVSNYGKEGYGPRLDVTVPPIAGGAGVITDFKVKINKTWTYKGKKMSFVNAKCPASKKLKYRGAFTYEDGTTIERDTTQSCTQKPEPKKK